MGEGQFEVTDEGDLWRLICAITLNKARDQVRYHSRQKRDVGRQESIEEWTSAPRREDEDPAWLAAWSDSLENWLSGLTEEQRSVLQMRLDGHTQQEIADKLGCAERTVRRILGKIQERAQADSRFGPA
jgi:RNA polymerase sigma factor (sigma-70 family)